MNVEDLVKSPAKCDELIEVLNEIARDVDSYDYGLPLYDPGARARLREAIYQWAAGALNPTPEPQEAAQAPCDHAVVMSGKTGDYERKWCGKCGATL